MTSSEPIGQDAYAANPRESRGRLVAEPVSPTRSDFQRDRDRIIHSSPFRRLQHKTQVFVYHEGDQFRTRLTHSIEVSQIARALARAFRVNEDLAEALALAHDFGHTPFGHAGERALARCMADHGGFDHNAQSLRIVTLLESRYAAFHGLNLTWETLEGLVKHNGPLLNDETSTIEELPIGFRAYEGLEALELTSFASLEAQCAAIADDIAYNNHDIDDGLRAGLFSIEMLRANSLSAEIIDEIGEQYNQLSDDQFAHEIVRRQITRMVEDVISETQRRLDACSPTSSDDVRGAGQAMVCFSEAMTGFEKETKQFLFKNMYRHSSVMAVMEKAEAILADLFNAYLNGRAALPEQHYQVERPRMIADHLAQMTDRQAIMEHRRWFDATPDLG
ncbi:MAG: deoxyguanosinetriphosphate triphosphohydrolase [Pseudomonadota bacterium]